MYTTLIHFFVNQSCIFNIKLNPRYIHNIHFITIGLASGKCRFTTLKEFQYEKAYFLCINIEKIGSFCYSIKASDCGIVNMQKDHLLLSDNL